MPAGDEEEPKAEEPEPREEDVGMDESAANDEAKDAEHEDMEVKAGDAEDAESSKLDDAGRPGEQEQDAADDARPKVRPEKICLNMAEATPNVMPSAEGKLISTLCDGGFQYLYAGVRANVGVKAGRYMFEVKIVEILNPYEGQAHRQGKTPLPKQVVRIGFSLAGSGVMLDDSPGKVYFDSEGNFVHQQRRSKVAQAFRREQVIGVLLNLDKTSSNMGTLSIFRNGQRLCDPQPLPENLMGKPLFPSITYKNMTLQVNWGPVAKRPLPFRCFMLREAAADDVEPVPSSPPPQDGRCEALFPIALPDQGLFDWLDQFLEERPQCLELSDRKVLKWAQMSGLFRPKGYEFKVSNDKPGMNFGIAMLDDFSIQKVLLAVAPTLRRDVVFAELNANLQASERSRALARFPATDFKRVALVAMGEPPAAYRAKVQEAMLAEKVAAAERRKLEDNGATRRKGSAGGRRNHTEDEEAKEEEEENEEEEHGEEKAKDTEAEDVRPAEAEESKPVELTAEEKAMWHRPGAGADLAPSVLAKAFASYTLPTKEEGFDEIRFVWQGAEKSSQILREWLLEHKRTQRVEGLEPSAWFKDKWADWQKLLSEWKKKQSEAKEAQRRKKQSDMKREDKRKDVDEAKKEPGDADTGGGEGDTAEKAGEEQEAKKDDPNEEEKGKPMDIDEEDVDVFAIEDVTDIGDGRPVFINFVYEDWTLLSLRYEFHLLVYAFKHDVGDPDRPGFHESHLPFYYHKYFNKAFNVKYFGVQSVEELCALIKDSAAVNSETKFLEAVLPERTPVDKFMRFTEDHRRERQRNIDAGDETANLKFTRPAPPPPRQQAQGGAPHRSGGGGGYQRPSGAPRGPPPPIGRAGAARGGYGYGGPPARSHDAGGSQKRQHTPPPPSPTYSTYPPAKHQRSGYGGGGGYGGRNYR